MSQQFWDTIENVQSSLHGIIEIFHNTGNMVQKMAFSINCVLLWGITGKYCHEFQYYDELLFLMSFAIHLHVQFKHSFLFFRVANNKNKL